jgi:hypothetical protein
MRTDPSLGRDEEERRELHHLDHVADYVAVPHSLTRP